MYGTTRRTARAVDGAGKELRQRLHEMALVQYAKQEQAVGSHGTIGIVCAGTSDIQVAEEARVTAELMGTCRT